MAHGTANSDGDLPGRLRVLVVDDDPMVAALTGDYLEHIDEALDVTYVATPSAALERLDGRFDCVVTAQRLTGSDGLSLVEATDDDTGAVLFTTVRDESVAEAAQASGAAYMARDTDPEQYERLAALVRAQSR